MRTIETQNIVGVARPNVARPFTRAPEVVARELGLPLFQFLYRLIGNQASAEKLAQEVCVKAVRSGWTDDPKLLTWALRTAVTLAGEAPITEENSRFELQSTPKNTAKIERCVQELPTPLRIAILLRKYHNLSLSQIGEVLGVTEEGAKALLLKAYETLRRNLNACSSEQRMA